MLPYIIIFLILVIVFYISSRTSQKNEIRKLNEEVQAGWGAAPDRRYSAGEMEKIRRYHECKSAVSGTKFFIDEITWNDLDMDQVFATINNTKSSIGEDGLYHLLRTPSFDREELLYRESVISYFQENKENSFDLMKIFSAVGRTGTLSFFETFQRINDLKKRSNIEHYILILLLLASFAVLFIVPPLGIILLIIMTAVNVSRHSVHKKKIQDYFISFRYLLHMLRASSEVLKLNLLPLQEQNRILAKNTEKLSSLKKGIFLLTSNTMSGSLVDVIMDYLRLLFHLDLIKFNAMLSTALRYKNEIEEIFEILGFTESMIAIASYRELKKEYCKPEFCDMKINGFEFTEIYHPLLKQPIQNSIAESRGVLLTGSNASGKSTFLKTAAINALMAQTIHTCLAKRFKTSFFHLITSISIKDSIESGESFYMAEIRSLKRIIDKSEEGVPVFCCIDEVLRGTNTTERIAASSHLLKILSDRNMEILCFAATHDIELTTLLQDFYSNYHFQEELAEKDIYFNYHLYKGPATTRNAIRLLELTGYSRDITQKAEKMARRFLETGTWTLENAD